MVLPTRIPTKNKVFKERQKEDFDRYHRAWELPEIPDDTEVAIEADGDPIPGLVRSSAETPCSYVVETQSGIIQRNRHHLKPIPNDSDSQTKGGDVVYAHVTITNILVVNQDPESPV